MNAAAFDLLRTFVDSYVRPPVEEVPVVVEVKEEPVVVAPVVPEDRCTNTGCKKKGKWDCVHKYVIILSHCDLIKRFRMCFPCCAAVKESSPECELCTGHAAIYRKIQGKIGSSNGVCNMSIVLRGE